MRGPLLAGLLLVGLLLEPAAGDLCVAENDVTGKGGEDPPPLGDLVRVNASGTARRIVAKGLQDPVWVVASSDSDPDVYAYVGLSTPVMWCASSSPPAPRRRWPPVCRAGPRASALTAMETSSSSRTP